VTPRAQDGAAVCALSADVDMEDAVDAAGAGAVASPPAAADQAAGSEASVQDTNGAATHGDRSMCYAVCQLDFCPVLRFLLTTAQTFCFRQFQICNLQTHTSLHDAAHWEQAFTHSDLQTPQRMQFSLYEAEVPIPCIVRVLWQIFFLGFAQLLGK
jgi:hypothetical protein